METMYLKYNDLARKNNVAIVSACGFDSVPADLGVQFTSNAFPASYQPSSIESFIEVQCGPQGSTIHATTYECIILGVASLEKTKQVRKAINYPKLPYSDPKLIIRNIPYFESRVGMYSMPFMGSDASVVGVPCIFVWLFIAIYRLFGHRLNARKSCCLRPKKTFNRSNMQPTSRPNQFWTLSA